LGAFSEAVQGLLGDDAVAEDAIYHTTSEGDVPLETGNGEGVIVQRDVKVLDDATGVFTRSSFVSIPSGKVDPKTGDWIEAESNWDVEAVDSDDGYILRLFVRPRS